VTIGRFAASLTSLENGMKKVFRYHITLITLLTTVIVGCAVSNRTAPISNRFLEDRDVTAVDKTLPFSHSWIEPDYPLDYYDAVYFRSVSIDKLPPDAWKDSSSLYISSKEDYLKEAGLLADYFKQQLEDKVSNYPKGEMKVVEKAGPKTLVFDFAFTELEFSNPVQNTGALLVPIPGSAILFSAISDPHMAFAARVTDGKTGKLVATAADRKYPPTRILDINKITVTSANRDICQIWAEIIADAVNRDAFSEVSSRGIFRLLPW
jgi:hypothetical protein